MPPEVSVLVKKQLIVGPIELRLGLKLAAARPVLHRGEHRVNLDRDARSRWDADRHGDRRIAAANHAAIGRWIEQVDIRMNAIVAGHENLTDIKTELQPEQRRRLRRLPTRAR